MPEELRNVVRFHEATPKVYVTVVQRIEQLPSKQWVAGSSPASHASIYASVVEWYTQQT